MILVAGLGEKRILASFFMTSAALGVLILFFSAFSFSQSHNSIREYTGQTIWVLPDLPDEQVDIGLWALIICKERDSSVDIPKYLKIIDNWAQTIDSVVTDRSKDVYVMAATADVMWETGPWNEYNPVNYDYDDPFGENLLSEYLETRRGNCISMPTLLLAIVERIDPGIPLFGAHAPMHMYCILKDRATGELWNAEATNGGASRNSHIIKTFNVPKEGIGKAYMRPLSKKETLAGLITNYLGYSELRQKNYRNALEYVDLALKLAPNCALSLALKGSILHTIGWEEFIVPIQNENRKPTPEEQKKIEKYDRVGNSCLEAAKNLGWRPVTKEDRDGYLNAIAQGKNISSRKRR